MEKDYLDSFLLNYLRRAISVLKVPFGSLILLDREKKIISMVRIGEFEFENSEMDNFFSLIKGEEPQICLKETNKSLLSFRKNKIKSEIIFPIELKDGITAVFFLPSFVKEHFNKENLENLKKIFEEIKIKFERVFENKKFLILYKFRKHEDKIRELLKNEFKIVSIQNFEQIKKIDSEFILLECPLNCSIECGKIFSFLIKNKKPFGILRPIEFRKSGELSFFCTYYKPSSKSPIPEKIPQLFKSLKDSLRLKISNNEKRLLELLSFLERSSMDELFSNFKTSELAKLINFSRSFFPQNSRKLQVNLSRNLLLK